MAIAAVRVQVPLRVQIQSEIEQSISLFSFDFMYTVYALSSISRNYIYVGLTSDLEKRIIRHNKGYERTTKPYAPFRLLYHENCSNRLEARIREKYWKSGIGREELRRLREQNNKDQV